MYINIRTYITVCILPILCVLSVCHQQRLMSGRIRKLEREKTELEGALSSMKKNNAAAQEELAKGNRKLAAELETVKKENIRVKEVCVCVCVCVCLCVCVCRCTCDVHVM